MKHGIVYRWYRLQERAGACARSVWTSAKTTDIRGTRDMRPRTCVRSSVRKEVLARSMRFNYDATANS